jgi:hypothetical protein
MTDLWTPSDDLLARDPIAERHVELPFDPPELEAQGVALPDLQDEEAIELAAALALAAQEDDDLAGDEPGEAEDDDEVDDHEAAAEPVAADV